MPDVEIPCVQCRENFVFTEKEQELFYQRNMPAPQRCQKCRSKKAANTGANAAGRFQIVCDHCGKHDYVPFQPKNRAQRFVQRLSSGKPLESALRLNQW
jgi:hypothetical protein